MTDRFDRAVLDAASRLARDPRTHPMLVEALQTARERSAPRRCPETNRVVSVRFPEPAAPRGNLEPARSAV
jgi:hypothetical protein